jgi:signal transduction histidine kinase
MVLARRAELARAEGMRIAEAVAALGRERGGIDYHSVRQKLDVLGSLVRERLSEQPFLRHIEVRDRFGARVLLVAGPGEDSLPPWAIVATPEEPVVTVQLRRGSHPEGEVRVGISKDTSQREIADLRRSLQIKVAIAAGFGVAVLLLGFLYVLHLIRKNKELEQSRLAAERRSYVGLLASGLAHEIRNPLNAMNMNLQMLEEELTGVPGLDGSDHLMLLASTKSEIKRLERLVNNFLAFARPAESRFESKDLNEILTEIARFLQADFHRSSVDLVLDTEPMLPSVEIDVTQFKQALMNLLVNARQVLRSGGRVVLRSRASPSGEILVEVEDNGPGISPESRDRIFEVFYSQRGGGTGLGLPIARQIVERHGGRIDVEDRPGGGTVFRIRLPRRHGGSTPSVAGRS